MLKLIFALCFWIFSEAVVFAAAPSVREVIITRRETSVDLISEARPVPIGTQGKVETLVQVDTSGKDEGKGLALELWVDHNDGRGFVFDAGITYEIPSRDRDGLIQSEVGFKVAAKEYEGKQVQVRIIRADKGKPIDVGATIEIGKQ